MNSIPAGPYTVNETHWVRVLIWVREVDGAWGQGLGSGPVGRGYVQVQTYSVCSAYSWYGLASGYRDMLHEVPALRIPQMWRDIHWICMGVCVKYVNRIKAQCGVRSSMVNRLWDATPQSRIREWCWPASHCQEAFQGARWLPWEPPAGTSE